LKDLKSDEKRERCQEYVASQTSSLKRARSKINDMRLPWAMLSNPDMIKGLLRNGDETVNICCKKGTKLVEDE
jgi:hypothetical protein